MNCTRQTDRLTLIPVQPAMLTELHSLFTDASVRRYLLDDALVEPDWVTGVITASQNQFADNNYGLWAVYLTGQTPIIGVCGYIVLAELQLIYALLPAYWGQGYATEASRVVVDYGFQKAGMAEIIAAADEPNLNSFGVMQRLGMTYWKTEDGIAYYRLQR